MHQVYELNIRTWQQERSTVLGRPATLADMSNSQLDTLVEDGYTWLYLLGVWSVGPLAAASSRHDAQLRDYLQIVLPGHDDSDIVGPMFSPCGYVVDPIYGGEAALAKLRDRARAAGLSLMLDFVPNHTGLDHPWITEHPDYFIPGTEDQLWAEPTSFIKLGDRIFAHGRDPFFPPWRSTVQLDYSNPAVQQAVMIEASSVAARCDGLRCDVAMLLLPDVYQNTWKRTMEPLWRKCLDRVRSEHPGTLFMAEVYWNREWELQQQGFDFTYDKMLYDRLRDGDATAIRAHLRAAPDYQNHCVRFLENHEEARAAAVFTDVAHHRASLILTGMTPGMLLCHQGQDAGLQLHSSLHVRRRPRELGSEPHRQAYRDLMNLVSEHARKDGRWRLLEPRGDNALIGCLWQIQGHHSLLVVVNASSSECTGTLDAGPLADCTQQFQDRNPGGKVVTRSKDDISREGIQVQLPAWGVQVWRVLPQR